MVNTVFYFVAKEGKKLRSKIKKIAKKVEEDDFEEDLEMVWQQYLNFDGLALQFIVYMCIQWELWVPETRGSQVCLKRTNKLLCKQR